LAEDFTPNLKREEVDALLEDLEENVEGFALVLVLLVQRQVRQIGQNREPEAFLHAEIELLLRRLCAAFRLLRCLPGAKAVLGRIVAHVLQVSLVEVSSLLRDEKVYQSVVPL